MDRNHWVVSLVLLRYWGWGWLGIGFIHGLFRASFGRVRCYDSICYVNLSFYQTYPPANLGRVWDGEYGACDSK